MALLTFRREAVVVHEEIEKKPYIKPEIVEELDLETRAGSPLGVDPDPLQMP